MAENKTSQQKPKKLSRLAPPASAPTTPKVVEQVPGWLRMLLGKYGEAQGRLIGLREDAELDAQYPPPAASVPAFAPAISDEEHADISALLSQMAEEGPPQPAPRRSVSSVEWGHYPAEEPADDSIDDVLLELGGRQPAAEEPPSPASDWMPGITLATDEETAADDIPDWLKDDQPAVALAPQPSAPAAAAFDIPDWLSSIETEPPAAAGPEPIQPAAAAEAEFDIPDWLSTMAPPVAAAETTPTAPPETVADITDWDVPDWLTEDETPAPAGNEAMVDSLFSDLPDAQPAGLGVPDWLKTAPELPASFAAAADDVPDWLASMGSIPAETTDDRIEDQTQFPEPDWMTEVETSSALNAPIQLESQPDDNAGDWLSSLRASMPAETTTTAPIEPEETATPEVDLPDWLSEMTTASVDTTAPEVETSMPDWLAAPPEVNEVPLMPAHADVLPEIADEPDQPASLSLDTMPDWLTAETEAAKEEAPDWLAELPAEETEPAATVEDDIDMPDWLRAAAPVPSPEVEEEAEAEEAPDWLAELPVEEPEPAVTTEDDIDMPDWLRAAAPVPSPEIEEEAEEEEAPDWLAELPAVESEPTSPAEDDIDMPDWLRAAAPVPSPEIEEEAEEEEAPDWLAEFPAEEPEPAVTTEDDIDMPDWLRTAAPVPSPEIEEEAEEEEAPDWLAELPAEEPEPAVTTEDDIDMPDWLRATAPVPSPEVEEEAEEEEAPDWLAEFPAEEPEPAVTTEDDIDMPDWLRTAAPVPSPEVEEEAEEEEAPDWLAELPAEETEPAATVEDDIDMPDWLRAAAPVPSPEVEEEAEAEEAPDWLAELPAEEPEPAVTTEDDIDMPDWLRAAAPVPSPEVEEEAEAEEAPDWLAELPAEETEPAAPAEDDIDMPDWLRAAAPVPSPEVEEEAEEEEAPDWLAELPAEETEPAATVEDDIDMPDWLAELPAEETEPAVTTEDDIDMPDWLRAAAPVPSPEVEEEAEEEAPDWLAELPEPGQAAPESTEAEAGPDWLTNLRAPGAAETPAPNWLNEPEPTGDEDDSWLTGLNEPAKGEAAEEDPTPDWLINLPRSTARTAPAAPEPEPDDADTPDWLLNLDIQPPEAAEEADMPDWLADLSPGDSAPTGPDPDKFNWPSDHADKWPDTAAKAPAAEAPTAEDDLTLPDWLKDASVDDIDTPDWLRDDTATTTPPTSAAKNPPLPANWLSNLQQSAKNTADTSFDWEEEPPDQPPAGDTLPKKSEGESSREQLPAAVAGDSPENITVTTEPAPESVPPVARKALAWLESYAPGPAAEGESIKMPETTGMLAGISAFLPAEKVTIPATAPGVTADNLAVAAQQFYQIATLPPQPATLPPAISLPEKLANRAARAAMYLLFIGLVALPLLLGWQNADGGPITEPARDFSDTLDSQRRQLISEQLGLIDLQQPDAVALVSFDYNAGTQGEMQPLAEAVLNRLKGQGMRIIAISMEPEGAAIAQRTIDKLLAPKQEVYGQKIVNLGFLPGQTAAIRRLITGETSLPDLPDFSQNTALGNLAGWSDVKNLDAASVVVTLADNPATARWWIEQLQLARSRADGQQRYLLAATSAAAEPFLAPYRKTEQLNGLIAGITGAAAIEAGRKTVGPARQMIDSMSVAHLLVVILIALGTIVGWMPPDVFSGVSPQTANPNPENELAR